VRTAAGWLDRRLPYVTVASGALGLALTGLGPRTSPIVVALILGGVAVPFAPRVAAVTTIVLVLAGLIGSARLEAIDAGGARLQDHQRIDGRAVLQGRPESGPFGATVEVEMASGIARGGRLVARLRRDERFPAGAKQGTEVRLWGTFHRVAPNPAGNFDYAAHVTRRGLAGALEIERIRVTAARRDGLTGAVDAIRDRAETAIGAGLSPTAAAVAHGMVLGADEAIPQSVRDDFRDSGLAHLLAASGTNVMLLSALALPLLIAVGLPYRGRIAVLLALIALYVPLAGGGPSIQRAGVMGAALLLAVALARPASRWYALGLAACATLALNPRTCAEAGWQLSFAAVAGILLLAPSIRRWLDALPKAVGEGIAITVAATTATAPLLAFHFETISLAGLAANLVALPLVAPIMWLGLLRAAFGQLATWQGPVGVAVGAANELLGAALGPLVDGLVRVAGLFADAPGAQIGLSLRHPVAVAFAYAVMAGCVVATARAVAGLDTTASAAVAYVRRLPRSRRALLLSVAATAVALLLARGLSAPAPPTALTVTFLDVGQGDATLIQHPDGSAVLFDGGPPEGGVARLLRRAGVGRLSALVMTHASRDHHGGLAEVVERVPTEVLLDGGDGTSDRDFRSVVTQARNRGVRTIKAVAPLTFRAGSLRIEVLSPPPRLSGPAPEDPNPRAVVAVVSSDGFDLFLSGDAESEVLLALALPDVEAMKVPHHGSADPGLSDVLSRLRPEVASIPVGENTYGHPAPSTLEALRDAAVPTWRNDRNGSVRLTVEDGGVEVRAERGGAVESEP